MAKPMPDGTWSVDSFRGEGTSYRVDLRGERASCSCPHFQRRIAGTPNAGLPGVDGAECKHITSCREQVAFVAKVEKARQLPDADLGRLLVKYAADPIVGGALRVARAERQQAAARDADLRQVFA